MRALNVGWTGFKLSRFLAGRGGLFCNSAVSHSSPDALHDVGVSWNLNCHSIITIHIIWWYWWLWSTWFACEALALLHTCDHLGIVDHLKPGKSWRPVYSHTIVHNSSNKLTPKCCFRIKNVQNRARGDRNFRIWLFALHPLRKVQIRWSHDRMVWELKRAFHMPHTHEKGFSTLK